MSKRSQEEIGKMLTRAYSDLTVDSFEKIQSAPQKKFDSMKEVLGETSEGKCEILQKKYELLQEKCDLLQKKHKFSPAVWGTVVAAVIAVAILFNVYQQGNAQYAYIYIDVNPSIELMVNKQGNVVSCKAYNSDGEDIVSSKSVMESVKNKEKLDLVMTNVIESIRDRGYFSGQYDSVLVSSVNTQIFEDDYVERVVDAVSDYARQKKMCNNVVYKEVENYDHAKKKGDKYGISPGKANYVEKIAPIVVYSEEELAKKNIDSIVDMESESAVGNIETKNISAVADETTTVQIEENTSYQCEETVSNTQEETITEQLCGTTKSEETTTVLETEIKAVETVTVVDTMTADVSVEEATAVTVEETTARLSPKKIKIKIKSKRYSKGVLEVEFKNKVQWSPNCIVRVTSSIGSIKQAEFIEKASKKCKIEIVDCIPGETYVVYIEGIKRKQADNYINCKIKFKVSAK